MEKLQDFLARDLPTAMQINPQAVIELCPCGTAYSFFNLPLDESGAGLRPRVLLAGAAQGQDAEGADGPERRFAGDHVELSDGGDDFASTVGVGAIVSTKFTWPRDPKPKDSFLLTPEREALWRKWIALYNERHAAARHLSRRAVRHRLRQAGNARGREGRPPLLRLLRAQLAAGR